MYIFFSLNMKQKSLTQLCFNKSNKENMPRIRIDCIEMKETVFFYIYNIPALIIWQDTSFALKYTDNIELSIERSQLCLSKPPSLPYPLL